MVGNLEAVTFLAPPQSPNEMGRLGPYRVLRVLGQGGMGVVFLAEDPQLERTVALKAMLPEVAQKGTARERFLREARATAKLEHDHIVKIYQVGEDRGVPFLAMQLLKGATLDEYVKKKYGGKTGTPLPIEYTVRLGREIARGLQAAHESGLIHRDIKPANIWLDATAGGRVKILDFGLARASEGDANLTQSGAIVGTAAYMAPEQARAGKVDGRTDLFSLGVILYRLCTGRQPWEGRDAMATLIAIATEEPTPIPQLNPNVPPGLSRLVMKMLAKRPEDRPQSAKAVADALQMIDPNATQVPTSLPVATLISAVPTAPPQAPPKPPAPTGGTRVKMVEVELVPVTKPKDPARELAVFCHMMGILTVLVVPVFAAFGVWLAKRRSKPKVAGHAKEALNFQLNILALALLAIAAGVVLGNWVPYALGAGCGVAGIVFLYGAGMAVYAGRVVDQGLPFGYPFMVRLFR